MLDISILTHFPEIYPGPLKYSNIGRNYNKKFALHCYNFADYALNNGKMIDDEPYGGGAGMVIRADILAKAVTEIRTERKIKKIYYPSPKGKLLEQKTINEATDLNDILFISGRFEGIDQRFIDSYEVEEFSIGDYVLCGGDVAILAFIEASVRMLPDVVGKNESIQNDSFATGGDFEYLLEHPHYTRPAVWQEQKVPDILLSGNHKKIAEFRLTKAKETTKRLRPDLFKKYEKSLVVKK